MAIEHLFFYKDSFGKDGKIQDVRKNALFVFFFEFGWIYGSILIVFSETMNRRMCNKTARFDRFRQLAPSQEAHILWMSPTLNKRWGDGRVHLQKWLSGHFFFLIVKLSVMEFSKRAMKRKPRDKRLLLTYRCGLRQGSLQDLPHCWANEVFVWLEGTTPFLG